MKASLLAVKNQNDNAPKKKLRRFFFKVLSELNNQSDKHVIALGSQSICELHARTKLARSWLRVCHSLQ